MLLSTLSPLVGRDLAKAYSDHVVLDGLELVANAGEPLGVVGENGVGKSTLLRLLSGLEQPDAGSVNRPTELAYLPQEPEFPSEATVASVLEDALSPLHQAVSRIESLAGRITEPEVATAYPELLMWAENHGAWDADRRARLAADRLGIGGIPSHQPVDTLSGGQRSRLALAALVARRPDCVLLDEPTNHLDDQAVEFLEEFLRELPGVAVLASHDRAFLDNVCAAVVDLDPSHFGVDGSGGNRFTGGYTEYLAAKRAARTRWEQAFEEQQDELDRLREAARTTARRVAHNRGPTDNDKFIYKFKGANVARTVSRRVRDAERRIEALESERIPKPPRELTFRATLGPRQVADGRALLVRDLIVRGRLEVPMLDVPTGGKLLVTGPNGCGKSTLLKVLAGQLTATSGMVQVMARRTGYLPQEVTFANSDRTPREVFAAVLPEREGSTLTELGLLHPRDLSRPVGVLSVGQQRRLALALMVAREPDLLLLDEPTNHISLTLAEELEQALERSLATVVLASHDRWLRRRWSGEVLGLRVFG